MLKKYLDGDSSISLQSIKDQESKEEFDYYLNLFSLKKAFLQPIMILPVFLFLIIKLPFND